MDTSPHDAESSSANPPELLVADARVADVMLADLDRERRYEKRILKWSVGLAFLAHGVLLCVTFPSLGTTTPLEVRRDTKVYVLQQPRFRPPPPPRGQTKPPEKRKKRIPIPDPTPHEPEPIVDPEIEIPDLDLPESDLVDFGIPDAPPGYGSFGEGEGPFNVGGDITPPVKIHDPQPGYTEEARMARIQGIVLLQAVLDPQGNVTRLQVLKGLPLGLTESALETVAQWKYKPATRDGKPVAVYLHLAISFSIQ